MPWVQAQRFPFRYLPTGPADVRDDLPEADRDMAYFHAVLDHIKHLNTRLGQIGVSLVLIGADLEPRDLVHDPQIAARLQLNRFGPYVIRDLDTDRVGWQVIVRDFEDQLLPHLPKSKPKELYTTMAAELHRRTQGYLGDLKALLCGATVSATIDGTHRILPRHLNNVELSKRAEDARHPTRS
jgi:hypothetical protein